MLAVARKYVAEQGLTDRVDLVDGDFFESVPAGGDAYVVRAACTTSPTRRRSGCCRPVRATTPDGARLLVVEAVVPPGNEPDYAKLDTGGFTMTRVVPTTATVSLLEAVPSSRT
jgi:hypothetical protein